LFQKGVNEVVENDKENYKSIKKGKCSLNILKLIR